MRASPGHERVVPLLHYSWDAPLARRSRRPSADGMVSRERRSTPYASSPGHRPRRPVAVCPRPRSTSARRLKKRSPATTVCPPRTTAALAQAEARRTVQPRDVGGGHARGDGRRRRRRRRHRRLLDGISHRYRVMLAHPERVRTLTLIAGRPAGRSRRRTRLLARIAAACAGRRARVAPPARSRERLRRQRPSPDVSVPTPVLHGRRDRVVPIADSRELARLSRAPSCI